MEQRRNHLDQPIGEPVPDWVPRPRPPRSAMTGRYCRIEPAEVDRHITELHAANSDDTEGRLWTYLAYGPFATLDAYRAAMAPLFNSDDPLFHAIIDSRSGQAVGVASYLRIEPAVGVIEVGHINYSPRVQRTPIATEAMYLMMRRAFDELGYRRYEWKCDALNGPSRSAAARLGFRYEGLFRQVTLYKGRNRDTAWFSIVDREWPALREAFERWLDPNNFDEQGRQKVSLSSLTRV
ncbi:MAG TPA: GNAT family protein [Stellaceae bacterium]|nr:GNAT family protein [Stellaceae bacterium]